MLVAVFPQLVQWEGKHPALPAIEFHPLKHSQLFSLCVWHSPARVLSWCYMISVLPVKARRVSDGRLHLWPQSELTNDENWIWFVFFFSTLLHYDKQQQKLDRNFSSPCLFSPLKINSFKGNRIFLRYVV